MASGNDLLRVRDQTSSTVALGANHNELHSLMDSLVIDDVEVMANLTCCPEKTRYNAEAVNDQRYNNGQDISISTPTLFEKFSQLPIELRFKIWYYTFSSSRRLNIIFLDDGGEIEFTLPAPPIAASVHHESRGETLRHYAHIVMPGIRTVGGRLEDHSCPDDLCQNQHPLFLWNTQQDIMKVSGICVALAGCNWYLAGFRTHVPGRNVPFNMIENVKRLEIDCSTFDNFGWLQQHLMYYFDEETRDEDAPPEHYSFIGNFNGLDEVKFIFSHEEILDARRSLVTSMKALYLHPQAKNYYDKVPNFVFNMDGIEESDEEVDDEETREDN